MDQSDLNDAPPDFNPDQKPALNFNITPPDRCLTCGKEEKSMPNGWFPITFSGLVGVMFLVCTNCHAVYTNTEAVQNTKKVNELIKQRREENEKKVGGKIIS